MFSVLPVMSSRNIAESGLGLAEAYSAFDAERRFDGIGAIHSAEQTECISGAILTGQRTPLTCPAFAGRCTPDNPLGAPMEHLADKRVGIIGTGATAVQCIPHLARACQELYVFQRTPSSVDVRDNRPIDPDWFAGIATPGWQQRWLENFTQIQTGMVMPDEDLPGLPS